MTAGWSLSGVAAWAVWAASVPASQISTGAAARSTMPADQPGGWNWIGRASWPALAAKVLAVETSSSLVLPPSGVAGSLAALVPVESPRQRTQLAASPRALVNRPLHGSSVASPPPAIGRWLHAPLIHRYLRAMAAQRQSCPPRTAMATSPAVAGAATAGTVVVDVEGKVAHPGVQMLPGGSRVYEALAAAGGALPGADVTALDLARPVTDGEQLRVGIAGAPSPVVGLPQPSAGGTAKGKRGKPAQPVNLNTATLEQLETVPDIGPALAQRILDWRSEHGRFDSVAQLRQVRGIGERKFADMRDSVTV